MVTYPPVQSAQSVLTQHFKILPPFFLQRVRFAVNRTRCSNALCVVAEVSMKRCFGMANMLRCELRGIMPNIFVRLRGAMKHA